MREGLTPQEDIPYPMPPPYPKRSGPSSSPPRGAETQRTLILGNAEMILSACKVPTPQPPLPDAPGWRLAVR